MILGQSARLASRLLHNGKGRPSILLCTARHLSTRQLGHVLLKPKLQTFPDHSHGVSRPPIVLQSLPVRFASTVSAPQTAPPTNAVLSTSDVPADDWTALVDEFSSADLLPIPEQIGYLKALGLDYGWGPTATIEFLLEHIHIYSYTPWWASIMLTALVVRLSLMPLYIKASDQGARLALATPKMKPLQDKIKAAKDTQDTQAMMLASQQLRAVMAAEGVNLLWLGAPFLQVFLGYGSFRLLRAMAALPVPGLDDAGFLWIKDLTIADPFYTLPIVTSTLMYITFKKGGETGTTTTATMTPGMRNFLFYGLPSVSFLFMMWWPACMQLTFATTSVLAFCTSRILQNPTARSLLRITPLPVKPPTGAPAGPYKGVMNIYQPPKLAGVDERPKGLIGGAVADIRGAAKQVMGRAKEIQTKKATPGGRLTPGELKRAKAYDEKRKREIEMEKLEAGARRKERRRL